MISDIHQNIRTHEGSFTDLHVKLYLCDGLTKVCTINIRNWYFRHEYGMGYPPGKRTSARLPKAYPRRSIRYPPWNIRGLTLFDYVRTSEGYPSTYIQRIAVTVYPNDIRAIPSPDFAHIGMRTHEHTRVCSYVRHFLVFLTIHEIHTIMFHSIC